VVVVVDGDAAIVDALRILSVLDDDKREQASDLLARIVAIKLCR
jgi:hypothetical protein